jgi:hypothetical protein
MRITGRLDWRERMKTRRRRRLGVARRRAEAALTPPRPGGFEVLCRIDAYADYVASVEASSAQQAAERAAEDHGSYRWESRGTQEFDARLYVTLDPRGWEIEDTEIRDF